MSKKMTVELEFPMSAVRKALEVECQKRGIAFEEGDVRVNLYRTFVGGSGFVVRKGSMTGSIFGDIGFLDNGSGNCRVVHDDSIHGEAAQLLQDVQTSAAVAFVQQQAQANGFDLSGEITEDDEAVYIDLTQGGF